MSIQHQYQTLVFSRQRLRLILTGIIQRWGAVTKREISVSFLELGHQVWIDITLEDVLSSSNVE